MTAENTAEGFEPDRIPIAKVADPMDLTVLVPSRGRPENIVALLDAFESTCDAREPTALYVAVDADDPELPSYQAITLPSWAGLLIGMSSRLGGALNRWSPSLAEDYEVVGFMGDDHRPRSVGWDNAIVCAMQPNGVVYGDDLIQGPNLPTAVFLDANIVRTLGHFVLPGQIHLFMDNYWKRLGQELGTLTYLPDVVIEHMHPLVGKAPTDEHYGRNNAPEVWEHDEALFKAWVEGGQMAADVEAIKAATS